MKSGWPEPRKKGRIELITEVIAERGRGMERRKKIGVGMVLLGAALWGSSSNSVEYLMVDQHFTWSAILFWRMVFTGISFLGISLAQKQDLLAPLKKDWLWLLKFILLGMYLMQVTFFKAIYYSNAATATVLQYTMPAILLLMYLVKEQRLPTRREVVAVVLALLGTTLIATKGQGAALAVSGEALAYGILSAFGMAFYTAYAAVLLKKYSCFLILGWGSLGNALLLQLFNDPTLEGAVLDIHTVAAFGILFVLGTLVAYYVYLESTKYIPPAETGALAAFEPLSAYFFSVAVMGNRVGAVEMAGALCIIVMVCVLARND